MTVIQCIMEKKHNNTDYHAVYYAVRTSCFITCPTQPKEMSPCCCLHGSPAPWADLPVPPALKSGSVPGHLRPAMSRSGTNAESAHSCPFSAWQFCGQHTQHLLTTWHTQSCIFMSNIQLYSYLINNFIFAISYLHTLQKALSYERLKLWSVS